jgi:preprotein translocase subunit YajC
MHAMISTILFLAQQSASPAAPQADLLQTLLPFLFMGVLFYFLLIRPQQKRQKQHQQLLANLKTGDKVVTSSGIHGLIANVKETTFLLKIADNVKIEIDKGSISGVEKQSEPKAIVTEAKPTT